MAVPFLTDWVKEVSRSRFSDLSLSFINTELRRSKPGGLLRTHISSVHTFTSLHPFFFFFIQSHQELRVSFTFRQLNEQRAQKHLCTPPASSLFQTLHLSCKLRWLYPRIDRGRWWFWMHWSRWGLFVTQEPWENWALTPEPQGPDFNHSSKRPQLYAQASQLATTLM